MRVKDSNGREVYVSLRGLGPNNTKIDEIYYTDDKTDLPPHEVEFIESRYDLYTLWLDRQHFMTGTSSDIPSGTDPRSEEG